MWWVNTDYARYLIGAANAMLAHYGDADAPNLRPAITLAEAALHTWGGTLHSNPDQAAKSPGNDVQDLLHYIAGEHHEFDQAIAHLEAEMKRLSRRG